MRDETDFENELDDDSDIRAWMAAADDPGRQREGFKRDLWRELDHDYQMRRTRTRLGTLAVAALLVSGVAMFDVVKVGGDNFEMIDPGWQSPSGNKIFTSPLSGNGMSINDPDLTIEEMRLNAEDLYERRAAGLIRLIEVDAWTIGGRTMASRTYDILGGDKPVRRLENINHELTVARKFAEVFPFIRDDLNLIDRGELPAEGTDFMEYEGSTLPMQRWSWQVEGVGPVIYRLYRVPSQD